MTLKLEYVNAVAVGHLNPAILQPSWYVRHEIIEPDSPQTIEIHADGSGLRYDSGGYKWTVSQSRLVVEAHPFGDTVERAGAFMEKTLRLLSHTPLTAVGHNFSFLGSTASGSWLAELPGWMGRVPSDPQGSLQLGQAAWNDLRKGARVQLSMEPSTNACWRVSINIQRVTGTAEEGAEAAVQAPHDFTWTKEFLANAAGVEVTA